MKNTRAAVLVLAAVLAAPLPAVAQEGAEVWHVAYDDLGTEFQRALLGTLELRDGVLRFTADNRSIRWSIDLADVKQISKSETYGEESNAVVIESLAGERLYVAMLDRSFLYGSPKRALKSMDAALRAPATLAAKAERAARALRAAGGGGPNEKGEDEADEEGKGKPDGSLRLRHH
jgi:hypothetical protein